MPEAAAATRLPPSAGDLFLLHRGEDLSVRSMEARNEEIESHAFRK
jgi:hypothetical protein